MMRWLLVVIVIAITFIFLTAINLKEPPTNLSVALGDGSYQKVLDSEGSVLNFNYDIGFNTTHNLGLHQIPQKLRDMFLLAEDKGFYSHKGVDWRARWAAVYQNIVSGRIVRGASTITEQVIRMLNPRKRNYWAKYLETIEAYWLESKISKGVILEFYLNQVPYGSNRRGVAQAAEFYFSRSLDTLNLNEQFALAILIRSPSRLSLHKNSRVLDLKIKTLANQALSQGLISGAELSEIEASHLEVLKPHRQPMPKAFIDFVKRQRPGVSKVHSTLDMRIQTFVEDLLNERLLTLKSKNVNNAAAIVVDHTNGHILSYAISGRRKLDRPGAFIDAIQVPRQPGSTLKPFLYAMAIENGHSAARVLSDTSLGVAVGTGLHQFHNYSNTHYGPVTLRQALANSLNIPAIRMISELGVSPFLQLLKNLGLSNLSKSSDFYGQGLALGDGEVSLYNLTEAYTALANRGELRKLAFEFYETSEASGSVFSKETASLIGSIMSDPVARRLEFNGSSLFDFPTQTAIKTGTSTDYRDAWMMAYNDKFLVGIWMGNLDRQPMRNVTGSMGPAIVARAIFKKLNEIRKTKALYLSPQLVRKQICWSENIISTNCQNRDKWTEWFLKDQLVDTLGIKPKLKIPKIKFPTPGLIVAIDPRLPRGAQQLAFKLDKLSPSETVKWELNGARLNSSDWLITPGSYKIRALVYNASYLKWQTPFSSFTVIE